MNSDIDFAAAMLVTGVFATAGIAFAVSSWTAGRRLGFERMERERGLPIVGKGPMEAVYAIAMPLGRGLAGLGVSANAITVASAAIAAAAAVLFATGHFGVGASVAVLAALADALDGIVARETGTASRFGQVLDTTVDRYVDAMFVGGIAFLVREDAVLFLIALAALVGGFMVSYASSVLRELGTNDRDAPMRRAHRLVYLLVGAVLVPLVGATLPHDSLRVQLAPVMLALVAIAVIGNVSAVRRLLTAARPRPAGSSARIGRASPGFDAGVVSDRIRHP
jgi:CDP-diacylglycerol--glycerol-3-phosphate 3-phosphatidyltransferase